MRWLGAWRNGRFARRGNGRARPRFRRSQQACRTVRQAAALILALREEGLCPAVVPSIVLVECLQGHAGRDALTNRFLKTCDIVEEIPEPLARRAAMLRSRSRRGSAVDALVVALAEPDGITLTSDPADLEALSVHATHVRVERV